VQQVKVGLLCYKRSAVQSGENLNLKQVNRRAGQLGFSLCFSRHTGFVHRVSVLSAGSSRVRPNGIAHLKI
jgi:hypothetical protein